jgi:hypothetical protein
MPSRGRPRTSALPRKEQLRLAKQAHRARQRRANIVEVRLALPAPIAAKLAVARRSVEFPLWLDEMLDHFVVRIEDYPQLHDLAWNRRDEFIAAKEAFQLYERNWRFIEPAKLDERERRLIRRLASEFGNDEINA